MRESVLSSLEPKSVFSHFEEISRIPRGSGNEKAVSDFIKEFAEKLGLKTRQDDSHNLMVWLPAAPGYENAPRVIIQGHLDMVCEKNASTEFDFEKDPLKLIIDGDFIRADGTTLGADNGAAVAYAMALMEARAAHPALLILLTADEEMGMKGAGALKASDLDGEILINIDSEEEGIFLASCAGGARARMDFESERVLVPDGHEAVMIRVNGLKGGHSGSDINKGRGNANKILARLLDAVSLGRDLYLSEINGGSKENAIPREAEAVVFAEPSCAGALMGEAAALAEVIRRDFAEREPGLTITIEKIDKSCRNAFKPELFRRVTDAAVMGINGVITMSGSVNGLVETSNNLGVIKTAENKIIMTNALRGSVDSRKKAAADKLRFLAETEGADFYLTSEYPAWEYQENSYIRRVFTETYTGKYQLKPVISAIHAGLECGLFSGLKPGLDMISFGPDIFDAHTPDERMSISSAQRMWEFLLEVLKRIK